MSGQPTKPPEITSPFTGDPTRFVPEPPPFHGAVPGYEILGKLGRGGMGVVYRARQISLSRIVALKFLLHGVHATQQELTRFRTEAQAVARLQHPHIVQVFEVGEHQGGPFLALEYCSQGSLDRYLQQGSLSAEEPATLVETLARALHAAHQVHIIHRDLKPANILLSPAAIDSAEERLPLSALTPKITDFGLAKRLDEQGQTASGEVIGTASYMAPEQASGKAKQVGPATDVYTLGAILYECLLGRPPYRAETAMDTLMQVLSDEPVPPRKARPAVPRDLEAVCLKCLRKDPRERYATAKELADDLHRYLHGEPVLARGGRRGERLWRWGRHHPWAVLAGSLLLLTGAVVLLLTLLRLPGSGRKPTPPPAGAVPAAGKPAAGKSIRVHLERLERPDERGKFFGLDQTASVSRVRLHGRAEWPQGVDTHLHEPIRVRVWVNDYEQFSVWLQGPGTGAQARTRRIVAELLLNRETNRVALEFPDGVKLEGDGRPTVTVTCARPNKDQRLHLFAFAPGERDSKKVVAELKKEFLAEDLGNGTFRTPEFKEGRIYGPLPWDSTREQVYPQVIRLKMLVARSRKNINDVVVVYFRGEETVLEGKRYLLPHGALRRGRIEETGLELDTLREIISDLPGIKRLILDVRRTETIPVGRPRE